MKANVVMLTSGKGGVGKSSVCASVGYHLARLGYQTLVIELEAGLRCLDVMLGVSENTVYDMGDVLCGRCEPIKAIYESPLTTKLSLMPATFRPDADYSSALFHKLCKGLTNYYDFILIETPSGFGQALRDIAAIADLALLVVTPDLISLRDAKIVSDYLDECGLTNQRVVINKVKTVHGRPEVLPDLDVVIDTVLEPLIGVIPYEQEIVRTLSQGQMVSQKTLASKALKNVARRLTGEFVELAME